MSSIYAIGDIHGELGMLEQALWWIEKDGGLDARIVFLGDYVDRGPDSQKVLDLLIQGQSSDVIGFFLKVIMTECLIGFYKHPREVIHTFL